jgi:hypothetical protein
LARTAKETDCGRIAAEAAVATQACERAIEGGQLAMAASLLRKILTPTDLDEAIHRQFGNHVLAQASPVREKSMRARLADLVRGPWAGIVTTNFDTLIEMAIGQQVDREVVMVHEDNPRLGHVLAAPPAAGFFFVKTHGSISGGRVVLSTEEYDRTYLASPRVNAFLSALFLRYFVIFVGCSLEDEVVRIRRKLAVDFEGLIPPAYALLPDNAYNRTRAGWLRDAAVVESILYPVQDDTHAAVDQFLAEAASCSDLATAGGLSGEITRTDLSRLDVVDRLQRIGTVNLELLRLLASLPARQLPHVSLVNLNRLEEAEIQPRLFEISAEERVYRMLFLVSVGLTEEQSTRDGGTVYRLSKAAADALLVENGKRGRV